MVSHGATPEFIVTGKSTENKEKNLATVTLRWTAADRCPV